MTSQQKQMAGLAVASLVLGILGLILLGPLGSIPAIICGHKALARIKRDPETQQGDGLALAGLILGYVQIGVMVLLLPLLAAILLPAVTHARTAAGMVATVSNGANIYKSAFAARMDAPGTDENAPFWPAKGAYRTSTEYFIHLVEDNIMTVSYDFFSAPGIPPAKSSDPRDFTAENNAWRLVLGLDDAPEGTPFLFTRNCDPGTLPAGENTLLLTDNPPFGRKGVVVVLKGGSAFTLKGLQLKNNIFNPAGFSSPDATEIVGP